MARMTKPSFNKPQLGGGMPKPVKPKPVTGGPMPKFEMPGNMNPQKADKADKFNAVLRKLGK